MMNSAADRPGKALIEGGVDAIIIGGAPDGLVAAAYLARAGLNTVLLEAAADIGSPWRRPAQDGADNSFDSEHLFHMLDPQMIDDLDLYSCGVAYAARRLSVTYCFEGGEKLRLGGDLRAAAQTADADSDALMRFVTDAFEASAFLRPLFTGAPGADTAFAVALEDASPRLSSLLERWMTQSAEDAISEYFSDGSVKTAMLAEAAFRNGSPLHEPMSFSPLLARWSGEAAGLQGGVAYARGGAGAVFDALRRAAQKAGVEFRTASPVAKILIEKDRAAGVELQTGNQLRAPIVISALDAHTTYLTLIGSASLDRAFQQAIAMRKPAISTAHLHLDLKPASSDELTPPDLAARIVFAPTVDRIRDAFLDAAKGAAPADMIVEAIFEDAIDVESAGGRQRLSVLAHPSPMIDPADADSRDAVRAAILASIEKIAPGVGARIESERLVLAGDLAKACGAPAGAFAAREGVYRQVSRAASVTSAGTIGGLYFCGAEAQIGYGVNGAAGRNAAQAALKKRARTGAAA